MYDVRMADFSHNFDLPQEKLFREIVQHFTRVQDFHCEFPLLHGDSIINVMVVRHFAGPMYRVCCQVNPPVKPFGDLLVEDVADVR